MANYNDEKTIRDLLLNSKRIAIVGLSDDPERPSFGVASYLQENGYEILPVNPKLLEWKGKYAYESLEKIPFAVDVVDIFRKPEFCLEIVASAIQIRAKAIWMQEGVINEEAAALASESGLNVVMDRCIKKEHQKLFNRRG